MRTAIALATLVLGLTTACGGDDGDVTGATDGRIVVTEVTGSAADDPDATLPPVEDEECFAAYPMGGGMTPDLAAADLVPADFPEPPVDATLCAITGNAEVGVNLGYLSAATPEEVVAGYLEAFAPYGAVSGDGLSTRRTPPGHSVTAEAGDVTLLVVPGHGTYQIHLDAR